MRYESTGYHKINTHSFRAYFITKVSRHDPNLAKRLAGQKSYLDQYDRLTAEEMQEEYLKFESDLFIFKQKPKSEEIQELQEEVQKLKGKIGTAKKLIEDQIRKYLEQEGLMKKTEKRNEKLKNIATKQFLKANTDYYEQKH